MASRIVIIAAIMNWSQLIQEIQRVGSGMTQSAIGQRLGKSQGWVGAVLAGHYADLRWSDGEALRNLHAEIVGATDTAQKEAA